MKQDKAQDITIYDRTSGNTITHFKFVTDLQSKVLAKHLFEKGYKVVIRNNQTGQILHTLG